LAGRSRSCRDDRPTPVGTASQRIDNCWPRRRRSTAHDRGRGLVRNGSPGRYRDDVRGPDRRHMARGISAAGYGPCSRCHRPAEATPVDRDVHARWGLRGISWPCGMRRIPAAAAGAAGRGLSGCHARRDDGAALASSARSLPWLPAGTCCSRGGDAGPGPWAACRCGDARWMPAAERRRGRMPGRACAGRRTVVCACGPPSHVDVAGLTAGSGDDPRVGDGKKKNDGPAQDGSAPCRGGGLAALACAAPDA